MATLNRENYIKTRLLSIFSQLDLQDEIVISGNYSINVDSELTNSGHQFSE